MAQIEVLRTDDTSLQFYTRDGITDYSMSKKTITLSNAIGGNAIVLTNGGMSWAALTVTAYNYVFDDGSGIKHYAVIDGQLYIDGVSSVEAIPFVVSATGFSGVTGTIYKLAVYDENPSVADNVMDYENEAKYW